MAGSSPRPTWVSHRGEVQPTLEQLPIMLQHPQRNQLKIKKTWLQHGRTMTSTWQNNVCNTSINFKNIAATSQKSNCNHHKKHG
jgi:hypothetical protein